CGGGCSLPLRHRRCFTHRADGSFRSFTSDRREPPGVALETNGNGVSPGDRKGGALRSRRTGPMDLFTRDDLKTLVTAPKRHCVSIFMPTHRGGGEADPIRCRAHVGEAEKRLVAAGLRAPEAKELLGPAHRLVEDAPFWKNQCDGLAL